MLPKLISLFTGAGGLDIGLEMAGYETAVASELEPYACESLRANKVLASLESGDFKPWFEKQLQQRCYKNVSSDEIEVLRKRLRKAIGEKRFLENATIIEGDVRNVTSADLLDASQIARGELDLVAGGPPCQPFSRAGKRENVDCDTGKLFKEFVRIVDDLRPRWFLFENVKGLVITKTDLLDVACRNCGTTSLAPFAARIGEFADGQIPCPHCGSFDVQQIWRNERGGSLSIILNELRGIGYKCYWKVLNAADFGAPQIRERLFIVGSRDGELFEWPKPTHAKASGERPSGQGELFLSSQTDLPPWETIFGALWKRGHFRYGELDRDKALLWVKNVVRPHDEPVTWSLSRPSPTIGAHQSAKLALAPFGVPEEQLARQQWHVLGRRQKDLPYVFVEHEYLTDSELLALQTFPSSWYLFGTRMQRAFQIGNAVPPVLAAAVGREILRASSSLFSGAAARSNENTRGMWPNKK
jgi:DNA (cytosine-5)-methyltransferase 1